MKFYTLLCLTLFQTLISLSQEKKLQPTFASPDLHIHGGIGSSFYTLMKSSRAEIALNLDITYRINSTTISAEGFGVVNLYQMSTDPQFYDAACLSLLIGRCIAREKSLYAISIGPAYDFIWAILPHSSFNESNHFTACVNAKALFHGSQSGATGWGGELFGHCR